MFKKAALLSAICLPMLATSASAVDVTGNLNVTATVSAFCNLTVGPTIAFGTITSTAAAINAASSIDVECSNGTPYTVGINDGNNVGRRMTDGTNFLDYELYSDAGRTASFFNIALSSIGGTGAGVGTLLTHNIFAQIPSQTTPPSNAYNDTVVVTVRY